jgi:cytochrome c oxidase subunit 2
MNTANTAGSTAVSAATPLSQAPAATQAATAAAAPIYEFPRDSIPDYAIPKTPYPQSVTFDDSLVGDPARGLQYFSSTGLCMGCHVVVGNPVAQGLQGPNLTHVGSRTTIAGALYPNTREYVARWIKNAPAMKPGALMTPQGRGIVSTLNGLTGQLDDQQIADVVAYLMSLK